MYSKLLFPLIIAGLLHLASCSQPAARDEKKPVQPQPPVVQTDHSKKIQVALLLDTSSSMDGLIEQAKSRLWNIVNTLTTLRYEGKIPTIEIALYEYGNDGLPMGSNYIRQISGLTTDLDVISEQLFSLHTYGGEEYCGAVISDATRQLQWGTNAHDMKLIYIAGNEEFNQGRVSYRESISSARKQDIYINTIFCGDQEEGIHTFWKDGAETGAGNFFTIDQNEEIADVNTPYDAEIARYNDKMNATYVLYGASGAEKKSNQVMQDVNAQNISYSTAANRTVSKANAVYKNDSWDLVDKVKQDKNALKSIRKDELPSELKAKSSKEIEQYVAKKTQERATIQQAIGSLAQKRQQYIDQTTAQTPGKEDLGGAIQRSIIAFAKTKGYTVAH